MAVVAAAAGLATAIWLPSRLDRAEANDLDRRGRPGQSTQRDTDEQVTFEDRFAGRRGNGADRDKWAVPADSARAVRLDGSGTLTLVARGSDATRLVTREPIEQEQGRLETRIKLPESRGARPALFLAGAGEGATETDLLGPIRRVEPRALDRGFHTVTVEWDAELAVASVDGDEVFRVRAEQAGDQWVFDGPFVVGMSLGVAEFARRSVFPQRMQVDLVRVSTEVPESAPPASSAPPSVEPTTPPPAAEPTTPPPPPAAPAAWEPFTLYTAGDKVTFDGVQYEVKETHTSLPEWQPPAVPNLFTPL
ncbi:carbohydrate-binding protein [Jidongwangia harbinensis]|uniref:carbohydrate-binding protein n=1 Tax=Jidongwangia harbinensis TaxID=2878561 RepID=UPI001CD9CD48|nr:carbohydrate-binding protein [Jidongwangia harbinensis]MCA2213404.1 hypothetical protein [Jidongwangia harbinensis]